MKKLNRTIKVHVTALCLVLAPLSISQSFSAIVSDFDDGVPDWDMTQDRGARFLEMEGHLVAEGNIPAKTDCITYNLSTVGWQRSLAVNQGERLSLRVDLMEASHNDVQALLEYVASGVGGYALIKDEDEIWLTKFQPVVCGGNAPFFYEQVALKNERVRLVLELERVELSLIITSKVLDLDAENAILFERTVVDTPAVDPTVPSFRGYTWWADSGPPIFAATELPLGVMNIADTAQPYARVHFDNLVYERQPVLSVENAIRLSWPASFPGMEVWGAPSVDGPWTTISEPVVEDDGKFLMTVPAPSSDILRVFRLEDSRTQ